MWLPIGTCLIVLQDFLEVATEQSLTRFTKHAKVVFPTANDRKDLQPAKKNSEQLRKKAGLLGSLGRFGVSKHRACGFDMPTCTEWCLSGLQRRTLEARSCNYKPCWFIYVYIFEVACYRHVITGWWFQIFFMFTPIWGRFPIWLIFFKGVETTNQCMADVMNWIMHMCLHWDSRVLIQSCNTTTA